MRRILAVAGLQEILTYSLVNPEDHARLKVLEGGVVELQNPLSVEQAALRKTLLIGALDTVVRNLRWKTAASFEFFEIGRVYHLERGSAEGPVPGERRTLGLLMGGTPTRRWGVPSAPIALFHLKGVIRLLCERLRWGPVQEHVEIGPGYHKKPAIQFRRGEDVLGTAGWVASEVLAAYEISEEMPVAYAELDLERLASLTPDPIRVQVLPKVPPVDRDLAIVVPEAVPHAAVHLAIEAAGQPLLKESALFDLYQGPQVPPTMKSLAFRLSFSDRDRTLTDEEISAVQQRILDALRLKFQATLR
jgi:phenylalanyl-tRNA synthetase beta chain